MEKYEKPIMEILDIESDIITASCSGKMPCPTFVPEEDETIPMKP